MIELFFLFVLIVTLVHGLYIRRIKDAQKKRKAAAVALAEEEEKKAAMLDYDDISEATSSPVPRPLPTSRSPTSRSGPSPSWSTTGTRTARVTSTKTTSASGSRSTFSAAKTTRRIASRASLVCPSSRILLPSSLPRPSTTWKNTSPSLVPTTPSRLVTRSCLASTIRTATTLRETRSAAPTAPTGVPPSSSWSNRPNFPRQNSNMRQQMANRMTRNSPYNTGAGNMDAGAGVGGSPRFETSRRRSRRSMSPNAAAPTAAPTLRSARPQPLDSYESDIQVPTHSHDAARTQRYLQDSSSNLSLPYIAPKFAASGGLQSANNSTASLLNYTGSGGGNQNGVGASHGYSSSVNINWDTQRGSSSGTSVRAWVST